MTSEGLGKMFEGDSADMCAGKFPLALMGGRAEGLACADPGARTPIGASGNCFLFLSLLICLNLAGNLILSQGKSKFVTHGHHNNPVQKFPRVKSVNSVWQYGIPWSNAVQRHSGSPMQIDCCVTNLESDMETRQAYFCNICSK